ncbi:MAG: FkbM family methyltransferase [Thiohalomonadaceae bacterium]
MNGREFLNRLLSRYGYFLDKEHPSVLVANARWQPTMRYLIEHEIFRLRDDFIFVQIGANDGVSRKDDLVTYVREYGVRGILVEPQRDVFKQLQENFRDFSSVRLVNRAIHATARSLPIYKLDTELVAGNHSLPSWARTNGIASFSREHVLAHARRAGLDEGAVLEEQVECITLAELFREYDLSHVGLLKVDTEGYDYAVLKTLDLDKVKPRLIRFEHLHMKAGELDDLLGHLITRGYQIIYDHNDTIAILDN